MADVDAWMKANRLRLNPQKKQLIWLGSRQQLEKLSMVDIELVSASLSPLSAVRNLGVTIDSRLTWLIMSLPSAVLATFSCVNCG